MHALGGEAGQREVEQNEICMRWWIQKTILSLAWPRYTGVSMEMEMERGRGEGREVRAQSQQNVRDRKSRVLG